MVYQQKISAKLTTLFILLRNNFYQPAGSPTQNDNKVIIIHKVIDLLLWWHLLKIFNLSTKIYKSDKSVLIT